ncbi:MAG: hypothetical protein QM793_03525 [Muricomes sp.]
MNNKMLEMAKELVQMLEEEKSQEMVKLSEFKKGDTFTTDIGKFIVLYPGIDHVGVTTEDLFRKNMKFDDDTMDYSKSTLKKLCDSEILKEFEEVFGTENIIQHEVDLTSVDMQKDCGTVDCKVRPLTFDEVRQYNDLLVNKDLEDWYWTVTPWSTPERGWEYSVAVVSPSGNIVNYCCCGHGDVRPFCILNSNIFVSKGE